MRKPANKKPAKPARSDKPRGPGVVARLRASIAHAASGLGVVSNSIYRAVFGLLVIAAAVGWIMGKEPLREVVAEISANEPKARLHWPRTAGADRREETWLPPALQNDLVHEVLASATGNPFDRDSLEESRARLEATGWFERLRSVRRRPGGVIEVDGDWRTPIAVVRQGGREFLVARGGEILRLPPGVPVSPGSMPVILGPYALPPTLANGQPDFGKAWPGGDVQDAISLIVTLRSRPGYERIVGVDLFDYMKSGHLTLIADTGARFIWGTPIGRNAPGEAPAERRLANLKSILDERRDAPGYRYEIYTPYVLVDTTMARD